MYKQGANNQGITINGARTGSWHMITITNDGSNIHAYVDASATDQGPAAITTGTFTDQILCIGGYSNAVALDHSLEHEWRLGKWSFHDHVLTHTEQLALFSAM